MLLLVLGVLSPGRSLTAGKRRQEETGLPGTSILRQLAWTCSRKILFSKRCCRTSQIKRALSPQRKKQGGGDGTVDLSLSSRRDGWWDTQLGCQAFPAHGQQLRHGQPVCCLCDSNLNAQCWCLSRGESQNHRIAKVGKDLYDHQVQPSSQPHHAC